MKEIQKYPYNARYKIGEENKIFLSDQVCKQVVKITYRNGQIFCTIKDRITSKKKEIMLLAGVTFGALFLVCLGRHDQSEFHQDSLRFLKLVV